MIPFPPLNPGSVVAPNNGPVEVIALTDVQRLFAKEYVKDFKAGKAAERCGMSAQWGYAQMKDTRILVCINENKRRHQETVDISIDATLENLRIATRVTVNDYFTEEWVTPPIQVDPANPSKLIQPPDYLVRDLVPLSEWTDEMRLGCAKLKATKYGWEIELFDKIAANVHIGRFFNMFTDTTQHVGVGGGPLTMISATMTPEQAAAAWADTLNDKR